MYELIIDGVPTGITGTPALPFPPEHPTKSGYAWLLVVIEDETPGANQTLGPVVKTVEAERVVWARAARAMTQQELRARDQDLLRSAVADAILVEVRLAQWILVNTAMSATDFRPAVRSAFQSLLQIANRLDPA